MKKLTHSLSILFLGMASACAVNSNAYIPESQPEFEAVVAPLHGGFEYHLDDPSTLSLEANVLGVTCSAVKTTGEFHDRFNEIADSAFAKLFKPTPESQTYAIHLTLHPETPTIMQLRRSYLSSVARVRFAIGADVEIIDPSGKKMQFSVTPDDTRTEVESEPTGTCSSNGKGMAQAFDKSTIQLMDIIMAKISSEFGA